MDGVRTHAATKKPPGEAAFSMRRGVRRLGLRAYQLAFMRSYTQSPKRVWARGVKLMVSANR